MQSKISSYKSVWRQSSLFEKMWLLAPVVVWFSFYPFVRLGQNNTMYFELSITTVFLLLFSLSAIVMIAKNRLEITRSRVGQYMTVVVGFGLLSLLWTPNLTRGVLTVGILGMIASIILASYIERDALVKRLGTLANFYVFTAVVMSGIAIVQLFAGAWLPQDITLLCNGCVAGQFGFARPNVFTIEPQFLGSLLLAPALICVWRLLNNHKDKVVLFSSAILIIALFLTLSRGAIFAWAIGVLLLLAMRHKDIGRIANTLLLIVVSFTASLVLQASAAALSPNVNETFTGAVSKTIEQLSLGVIDIPEEKPVQQVKSDTPAPKFDGYVEESTTIRLNFTQLALMTWSASPQNIVAGVGIGGAGQAMHTAYPAETSSREIVQNEYIERLLESGIIGSLLFIGGLMWIAVKLWLSQYRWLIALLVAFAVQWNFFSGYPNALHIYFVLALLVVAVTARHESLVRAKLS